MTDGFATRLKYFRSKLGLSQNQLSSLSNISSKQISDYEVGRNNPRRSTQLKLIKGLGVNEDEFYNSPIINTWDDDVLSEIEVFSGALGKSIKVTNTDLRIRGLNLNHLIVKEMIGDSLSPVINSGDMMLINTDYGKIIDGKIYYIKHGDLERYKRVFRLPNSLRLCSYNSDVYPEEIYNFDEPHSKLKIIGEVVYKQGFL